MTSDQSQRHFENVDLQGAEFHDVDLRGATFRHVDLSGTRMLGVELVDVVIEGEVERLTINGVDVAPLVEAELDRRDPDRATMRPDDPAGFREAWDVVERLWAGTVERARGVEPDQLHESVNGEWSFIETLRHLAFATDAWVSRAIRGVPSPWHPLELPWDQMPDTPGTPRDREAYPSLDEALALRHDRMARVREVVDELTDDQLTAETAPLVGAGWPPEGRTFAVKECLLIVLNEEYHHRLFAERDLDALESRAGLGDRPREG